MRDLSRLRWERENRRRIRVVPAASRSAQPRGQECHGWRIVLFHSEWHTKYRHAGLANARSGHLALSSLHSEFAQGRLTRREDADAWRPDTFGVRSVRRFGGLQIMPQQYLRALEEDANGEHSSRSAGASRRNHP